MLKQATERMIKYLLIYKLMVFITCIENNLDRDKNQFNWQLVGRNIVPHM